MFCLTSVLMLLHLAYQFTTQAADASSIIPGEEGLSSSSVDYRPQRTLLNIILGCVSTMTICAWAVIHPNIPPREGPFKATLRKLELMFWTVVAPEILPAWALNQRLAAMTIRDLYNEGKGVFVLPLPSEYLHETRTGYEKESCGIWKTVRRWFSLYEMKEAGSQGGI